MNFTLRFLCITFAILPFLPVIKAISSHSLQPLGYLVWFILGSMAMTTADMAKKAQEKDQSHESQ